jgi:anti-sigma regulatory factor (Ser/Thr protein kinase)
MTLLAAMSTAPGHARAHVRSSLVTWEMSSLTEAGELVATELVTNAVRASARPGYSISGQGGMSALIGLCLLADARRLRIEVWDQAAGFPVLRETSSDAECGRGLLLVDAMTEGVWGWHVVVLPQPVKCVWAELGLPTPVSASTQPAPVIRSPNLETRGRNMTTTKTEQVLPVPVRDLISPGLFSKLACRVAASEGHDLHTAERIVEQTLAFLVTCARHPEGRLSPSETVDAGWHAFILHTADYGEFCDRIAGRFIHHRPNGPSEAVLDQQAIGATIAAMRHAGVPVDPELWVPRAECSQCYQGCADDPEGA